MKVKTQKRPPAVVQRLLEPWFDFGNAEPWAIAVGRDRNGQTIYAPVSNPEAFDVVKDRERML